MKSAVEMLILSVMREDFHDATFVWVQGSGALTVVERNSDWMDFLDANRLRDENG